MAVKKWVLISPIILILFACTFVAPVAAAAFLDAGCGTITDPGSGKPAPVSSGGYSLKAGRNYTVQLTFRNTGTLGAWNETFGLGPKRDAPLFNPDPVMIKAGKVVHKGDKYTFRFTIQAPKKRGTYDLRWQMFQETYPPFFGRTARWVVVVHR